MRSPTPEMRGRIDEIMHMCGEVEVAESVTLHGG